MTAFDDTVEAMEDSILEAMDEAAEGKKGGWCKWEPKGARPHTENALHAALPVIAQALRESFIEDNEYGDGARDAADFVEGLGK